MRPRIQIGLIYNHGYDVASCFRSAANGLKSIGYKRQNHASGPYIVLREGYEIEAKLNVYVVIQ